MKIFWPIASVLIAAGIFASSSVSGEDSGGASMTIALWAQNIVPLSEQQLNFLVRKGAHFTVYFALGFSVAQSLKYHMKNKKAMFALAWGIASLYGVLDEMHQFFVPGRMRSVRDMVINSAGALVGAAIVYFFVRRGKYNESV